ncbi:MAG TPA: SpoIID/LytB domain-containing protein, partial [Gemmatimonadaceae bacterium]|nr:SpoIID/LytB domain-containing protein [Gemmatimonadaceae bacterium]
MRSPIIRVRAITAVAIVSVLGFGACVSLSSPGAGSGNVPVVRGSFKNGRDQIVRIALATAVRDPSISTETSTLVVTPEPNSFVVWNGKRYRGELVITGTDSGHFVVNRLSMDDYLRGVVPLEIGNRTAAEFAAVQAQAVAARTY